MRRAILLGAVLALSILALPAGAPAQKGLGAPDATERFVDEFDDPDFCGTGETVHVVKDLVLNIWDRGDVFRITFRDRGTFTYGDATVIDQWAGRGWDVVVEGDDHDGPHSHLITETGLRAFIKGARSGRAVRDAGNIQFLVEFGADHEFLGFEVVENKGPHPDITEGTYCEAAIDLLGIGS